MTYRYAQMCCGRNLPNRGVKWDELLGIIPLDRIGNEIAINTPTDDMMLWNRKIISYQIKHGYMYATLEGRKS